MATPDPVFLQTYAWYRASVQRLLAGSALPAADRAAVEPLIWQMLGLKNPAAPPGAPDRADFRDNGAAAESIAIACQVLGESLAALTTVQQAVAALQPGGNPAAALAVLGPVLQ